MSAVVAEEPVILHVLPGRVRVRVPGWNGDNRTRIEADLRKLPGVRTAEANPATGNCLIRFDPAQTSADVLLSATQHMVRGLLSPPATTMETLDTASPTETLDTAPSKLMRDQPSVFQEGRGPQQRARIAVRGVDRDPRLARRVVERLEQYPSVRARVSALTGRVLVEFDAHRTHLDDLIAEVSGLELPDLFGEDRPAYPLDPGPLIQGTTRTIGAALGFGFLTLQRLFNAGGEASRVSGAAQVSAIIGVFQSIPFVRYGLRRLLGRTGADLLINVPGVISLALAGNPLGLALTGAESVRLVTEVMARRTAWKTYVGRLDDVASAQPGTTIQLRTGERTPLGARTVKGTGTAIGPDALPVPVAPGATVPAGARLFGGPFVLELQEGEPFTVEPRATPTTPTLFDRYIRGLGPLSLAYAALTAIITRSPGRTFASLLLVNPRTAMIGAENADLGANARVLRAGVTVIGTRADRTIRRPDVLLLDQPRTLTAGFELTQVIPMAPGYTAEEIREWAASVAIAAGGPWGGAIRASGDIVVARGSFNGTVATAQIHDTVFTLGPAEDRTVLPAALRLQQRASHLLLLRSDRDTQPLGVLAVQPRLAPGVVELVETCRHHKVELRLLAGDNAIAAQAIARRAQVTLVDSDDAVTVVREQQAKGLRVAVVSDSPDAAPAFSACDLAIGLSSGRSSRFAARADLLAPDLAAIAAIVEAGARRDDSARDAVVLSLIANGIGAAWGLRGAPGIETASRAVYVTALTAIASGWARLRGGERPQAAAARLVDPRPERWGQRSIADTLTTLDTTETGLTAAQAAERQRTERPFAKRNALLLAMLDQLRSPITGILAVGAGISVALGTPIDALIIGAAIAVNAVIGAWQEHQAGEAAEALAKMGTPTARVLRDGVATTVLGTAVVPGDVLLLATGDRVAADARVLNAQGLEVDEAALTGESLPVPKVPAGGTDASRVVLEGSDVTVGTGQAIVFAVGQGTRIGATAAALSVEEAQQSPLSIRLSALLRQLLPVVVAGGALVVGAGFLRGRALLPQLAIGASIAIAAVPEGLPLLAGVGQAAVARRLAGRNALVRRLSAVEALGRVDIACTDKTGTLTEGRLALRLVANSDEEMIIGEPLSPTLRQVLLAAAIASPHPDAPGAGAHPTDNAVVQGAQDMGLGDDLRSDREREVPFDPERSFHATVAQGRLYVKGAVETLAVRCDRVRQSGENQPLNEEGRQALLAHAEALAGRGLRVLMIAEGTTDVDPGNPQTLIALGFLGIADPLRPTVPDAVRRCQEAGVRVIMLTGDHPATARAIAREAGLLGSGDEVLTGNEIAELAEDALDQRLERVAVIARVTPLDKLRIVESLQRRGHIVAMTGDGVNDAPALRLADVGVAMGKGGTEVARQAAAVVLADDDFATLVEALVEGRSFWRNIRRAIGLLLGGNLGELGLVVGASVLGFAAPLITRQILAVNLVTDALPALSIALQPPQTRNLASLAREGTSALDAPLRRDVIRRGLATALPSLAAYLLTLRMGALPQAQTVAFASIVATQLAQTLDLGWAEGTVPRSVLAAVLGSSALMVVALTVPPLQNLLGLVALSPPLWALIALATLAAVAVSRLLATPDFSRVLPTTFSLPRFPQLRHVGGNAG